MKYAWCFAGLFVVGLVVVSGLTACDSGGSSDDVTVVVTNAPPGATCKESDMVGTWKAPDEVSGTITHSYTFVLSADHSATFTTGTADSGPPPTASASASAGNWGLAGCNLVLDGFGGGGDVSGGKVTTDGRTFTRQ